MGTANAMGFATVPVYSDADARAPHGRMADERVRLGPPPAAESYLLADLILAAARETGADAIHPGYGFLSERESFARLPVACSVHTRFETYFRYYNLSFLEPLVVPWLRKLYRKCDALIAPSEHFAHLVRPPRMNYKLGIWT